MKFGYVVFSLAAIAATVFDLPAHARTATTAERTACEAKIRPKLDRIESRLRAGYTAREGETLREQQRKLEAELLNCRKIPK
jgi:hypothetical protein